MLINIAKDFSRSPKGRYHPQDGNQTGQQFRDTFLIPVLQNPNEELLIDLDGALGYPSSFLEEAFGGLVRGGFSMKTLKARMEIKATEPRKVRYIDQIWDYIAEAKIEATA